MPLSGLSNHLRLSEGLSCLDYHAGFRALAIGSTRQIHVVEVIPMVGHDVAATARFKRTQQQAQQQHSAAEHPQSSLDGERPHASPSPASLPAPPPPMGTAPFLMRNTGVFGGLIKVESVTWYPSTEEASLAFIQPGRTVTIFLDALQFKADGTYLPQQWTRSQYKGKTLNATMAAGGGSTAMAVVANLDGGLAGMTPATSTTSLGERSGIHTPMSTSLAGGASFSGVPNSHGGTPHETSIPTPNSAGSHSGPGLAMNNLPCVVRERKGPVAKELIELNIDITYMRVEKIVWDPHQSYTLALSSPTTHFELWQVPTEGTCVYAPQLVLRPPAHNTRSVVRDIAFSPSNQHIIIVVTESGNMGQVLLYDRRQVEATRVFDMSGPGLSAAFHPLFSDLLAVCFRKEKTKPDTRISFLCVMSGDATPTLAPTTTAEGALSDPDAPLSAPDPAPHPAGAMPPSAGGVRGSPTVMSATALQESMGNGGGGGGSVPASGYPYLAEQTYLPPIDNYACVSRMRWRPPSLGRLTEPKRHHYMVFRPSAEDLWAARQAATTLFNDVDGAEAGDSTHWVDILHSQLWFATAAVTTDSDLSVWDAANGFFPVCAVKYLGARVDSSASNEANDFIWVNELTLVSVFKSGEVICTGFLNSPLEAMLSTGEAYEQSLRPRRGSGASHMHRPSSSTPSDHAAQHPVRSESIESKVRAEEKACLAMMPAYPRDPYADVFATYIVLPASSVVSDLFGRSFVIRNSNATIRHLYNAMIRREFGQLLRRLAIQVSREAVLRRQWSNMRCQPPSGGAGSPGILSGLAALQELRSRRPHSPCTQTNALHGRGTSSQGSDSTPPSPRRSVLARRYSATSSVSSFTGRATQPVNAAGACDRGSGTGSCSATATTTAAAAIHGTAGRAPLSPPSATSPVFLPAPTQAWSLDDVNGALLLQAASQRGSCASPTGLDEGDDGAIAGMKARSTVNGNGGGARGGSSSSVEPAGDADETLEGMISGCEDDMDAVNAVAVMAPRADGGSPHASGGGASAWIKRLLGFARHQRVQQYRSSVSESRAVSLAHSTAPPRAVSGTATQEFEEAAAEGSAGDNVDVVTHPSPTTALSVRRRLPQQPTSPISVSPVENSESSTGSPQQQSSAAAGSPLQAPDGAAANGEGGGGATSAFLSRSKSSGSHQASFQRAGSTGPRPGTSASSSSSPLLTAPTADVGALNNNQSTQPSMLHRAAGSAGDASQRHSVVAAPSSSSSMRGGGIYKSRRSGVVFTRVFPLLKEHVDVWVHHRGNGGSSSSSAPGYMGEAPRCSSPAPSHEGRGSSGAGSGGGMDSAAAIHSAMAQDAKVALSAERGTRKPALLLSPLLQPSNGSTGVGAPKTLPITTSPLQLPLSAPECGVSAADAKPATTVASTAGTTAVEGQRTPSTAMHTSAAAGNHRPMMTTNAITARAYLDRQRDVTAVVESFVLSDVVCGWSYPERQREEFAFVRFALEWDMGYELALTMKALRHDRVDAEAAAEAALAAEAAAFAHEGTQGQRVKSSEADADDAQQQQQRHPRSNSSGGGKTISQLHRHYRYRVSSSRCSPITPNSPVFPTTQLRSRSGDVANGKALQKRHGVRRLLDWGSGAPTPSHEDVDDKVASMMEENARICERVAKQRQQQQQQQRGGRDGVTGAAGPNSGDHNGGTRETSLQRPDKETEGGESSGLFAKVENVDGSLITTDPRAQWWRAAAHAWRSHHISFILSITMQQLEYASLMGDVQYCLVLYILCCVWWRLHSEVAEAAYRAAVKLSYCTKYSGVDSSDDRGKYAQPPFATMADHHNTTGSHEAWVTGTAPGDRRHGMSRVSTMTSVDGDPRDEAAATAGLNPGVHYALVPPCGSADVSERNAGNAESKGGPCASASGDNTRTKSSARVEQLHRLRRFFQLCPLMPVVPDRQAPSTSPANTSGGGGAAATTGMYHGGEPVERGPLGVAGTGGSRSGGGCGGGFPSPASGGSLGSYLRTSASYQSLPPRSQNSSSRRLNNTPATPAMADPGSTHASAANLAVVACSQRSSTASPTPAVLRMDVKAASNAKQSSERHATSKDPAHQNEHRLVLVDLEGLLGVRIHAQTAEDLCASAGCCSPEEWKLRALQWLETYTADLYARQLYVPLNELLLIIPEIFREPTNPVQPRAADIAYEKQMTYVYCGNCSKAELWSRTQQETVPAAVRLYERVVCRCPHSSSSEEEESDSDSDDYVGEGGGGDSCSCADEKLMWCEWTHRRRRRHRDDGNETRRLQRRRQQKQRQRAMHYTADSNDDSSSICTPSVESPTSSSDAHADGRYDAAVVHARDHYASSMNSDVTLSSEHGTLDGDGAASTTEVDGPAAAALRRDEGRSSWASTAGDSPRSTPVLPLPTPPPSHSPPALPAQLQTQQQQRQLQQLKHQPALPMQYAPCLPHRRTSCLRTRHSPCSLDGEYNPDDIGGAGMDVDDDDVDVREASTNVLQGRQHAHRHTAVGCSKSVPSANNAACRRCHNRTAMTCVICEEVVEGVFFWLRSCGHGGHVHHIEEWLQYSQECPKCGVPISATWKGS
jgi:hypothetical protein